MPLRSAGVKIRWDEGIRELRSLDEAQASSEDGIDLNHAYADYRGVSLDEAAECVEEEAHLLADLADAGWDTEKAEEIVEENAGAMGLTSHLDPGVAGLVMTLSALGGTPISSCNGGFVGVSEHLSDVPNILFTAPPETMDRIISHAMIAEVGLIFNEGYAEAFVDHLPNFHRLAKKLLDLPTFGNDA
jgi:hypothetical protein